MHELSLCSAIADTVTEHADGRPILCVRVRVGHFRQVVPTTLAYCWELHTRDSPLDGAVLEIDHVPAVIACRACGHQTTLQLPVFRCDGCGGNEVDLVSGEEFMIDSIDLGDRPAPHEEHA